MGSLIVKPKLDIDAKNYIDNVQNADGALLELNVKQAVNRFVKGCKSDGIWDAIHTLGLLFGARTLEGALIPLKGTTPTNYNFVLADYDRNTGLAGNGIDKYLDTGIPEDTFPQGDFHMVVYKKSIDSPNIFLGASTSQLSQYFFRNQNFATPSVNSRDNAFIGHSRNNNSSITYALDGVVTGFNADSQVPSSTTVRVYGRYDPINAVSPVRLRAYSFGTDIDLSLYYSRMNALVTQITSEIV